MARRLAAALVIGICLTGTPLTADEPGSVRGCVISIDTERTRTVVPGAKVLLMGGGDPRVETTADEVGAFRLEAVVAGAYRISASSPGMNSDDLAIRVASGETLKIDLELKLRSVQQSVTVEASAPEEVSAADTAQARTLTESTIRNARSANERVDTLLPSIPGVVRGPDGLINMKGARSSQSSMLVNSANVTDPVTGYSVNHWKPRAFQANLASDRYGEFFNSVERIIRGKFVVEF